VRAAVAVLVVIGCASPTPEPKAQVAAQPEPEPEPLPQPQPQPQPEPQPEPLPQAAVAPPPPPTPEPKPDDWIDVATVIPDAVIDMRYARAENFTRQVLYPVARCLLRRAVADRLVVAAETLRGRQRRLLLWDCYRPAALQQLMWDLVKDSRYVAEPKYAKDGTPISGSRHSRGAAIDVGLVDAGGNAVPLPTEHDDFTKAAHRRNAKKGKAKAELALLDEALVGAGFTGMPTEWWHYDAPESFPLATIGLDEVP
jgi:zinc D-Ala-D-Ala dipeptidase